jgi:hypothetical protein
MIAAASIERSLWALGGAMPALRSFTGSVKQAPEHNMFFTTY